VLSGQSAAAFCRKPGILAKSFYRWRDLLEKSTEEAFVRLELLPTVKTSLTDSSVFDFSQLCGSSNFWALMNS
jgi:hypothetical protein